MAIYRAESGRRILIVAFVALVAGLVIGCGIGRATAPTAASQVADLRTQVAPIRSSLDVIRTEYPKLLTNASDPGGAPAAMARIRTTFDAVSPTLTTLDPAGTAKLDAAITSLANAIEARMKMEDIEALISGVIVSLAAVVPPGPLPSGG